MLARTPVVYTKMVEEVPPPKQKLNKKQPKKMTLPRKSTLGSPKTPRKRGKSPSPQKKGKGARAELQLEGPEFGPPEEPPVQTNQPSLIALENAHLHAFNQLSLVNMRQVNQEEEANNQQVAVEQRTYVNEANAQLVLKDAALRRKWEAEPDDEKRERLKMTFSTRGPYFAP